MTTALMIAGGVGLAFAFGFCIGWKGGDVDGYNRCLEDIAKRWKRRFE